MLVNRYSLSENWEHKHHIFTTKEEDVLEHAAEDTSRIHGPPPFHTPFVLLVASNTTSALSHSL